MQIFSEPDSYESMDVFRNRQYEVVTHGTREEAWTSMLHADVFIMSQGSFSDVPAFFAKGRVVYSSGIDPLPSWEVVDEQTMNRTKQLRMKMRSECQSK